MLPYDHFHSNTHEVLGLAEGTVKLKIGGQHGVELVVETGDVIIMPAGVGHYSLYNSSHYLFIDDIQMG
ncbi:cupin domain-containing protein [Aquirufa sp. ROCK-SH2]